MNYLVDREHKRLQNVERLWFQRILNLELPMGLSLEDWIGMVAGIGWLIYLLHLWCNMAGAGMKDTNIEASGFQQRHQVGGAH